MLGWFTSDTQGKPTDVKGLREALLQFIKDELKKLEGGEGKQLKSLQLYLAPEPAEKHLFARAVYADEEGRFQREEVQRIVDDYGIDVPQEWVLQVLFTESLPLNGRHAAHLNAAILINAHNLQPDTFSTTAYIRVLSGEATQKTYTIQPEMGRINIGREAETQTANGFFRVNNIAFPGISGQAGNRFVSREHAHIEFDNDSGCFLLFADEGGVPPRNKIKVRSATGELFKLQTTGIAHVLRQGDQILLGESALLEFTYTNPENQ